MQEKKHGAGCDQPALEVMNRPPRARARVVCHTEVLNEPLRAIPRVRAGAHETGTSRVALAGWRIATFGGDFDPVRAAVDEAVSAFSSRQPDSDRAIWLKVANQIGYEAFRDLYHEQKSILDDCIRRGNPLRAPAAAFQARLNLYTDHGEAASCRSQVDSRPPLAVGPADGGAA